MLQRARGQIWRCNGNLINTLVFNVDDQLRSALKNHGIALLTPDVLSVPFVCLRGTLPAGFAEACRARGLSAKRFDAENVVRISGTIRGTLASAPEDRTADLLAAIQGAVAHPNAGVI